VKNSRQNLRIGIIEGLLSTPYSVAVIPGSFIIAALLTQWFGIGKSSFGWIVSMPSWTNVLQAALLPFLARGMTPKGLVLGMGWFNVALWALMAALIGFLPRNDSNVTVIFFLAFFFLASASAAFQSVGWITWVREWVPAKIRGTYLGKRNSWMGVATMGFLGLVMLSFKNHEEALPPYLWVMGAVVVGRLLGLLWMRGIRTRHDGLTLAAPRLTQALRDCLSAPGLPMFILFSAWMNFWMGFTGPFGSVFCFEELGLDPGIFATFTALAALSGILGWVFWGRISDRAGNVPVIVVGLLLWEMSNFLWVCLQPTNAWLLYPMFVWAGFFSVAFFMGSFNLLLNLSPRKNSMSAISIHMAVTSLASAIAPIIAGSLLQEFLVRRGGGIAIYQIGFAMKSISVLIGLLLLFPIREPGRGPRRSISVAFRAISQTMATQGLELFLNLIPMRNIGTKKRDAKP
jgi:MFS family permease